MSDSKEIELTNTSRATRSFRDADGRAVNTGPGETAKANVTPEMHKRLSEWAEGGSPLVMGKPKGAPQQRPPSANSPQQSGPKP